MFTQPRGRINLPFNQSAALTPRRACSTFVLMRARPRGKPATIAQARERGVTRVRVFCEGLYCPNSEVFDIGSFNLADDLPVLSIPRYRRFVCTSVAIGRSASVLNMTPRRKRRVIAANNPQEDPAQGTETGPPGTCSGGETPSHIQVNYTLHRGDKKSPTWPETRRGGES
jgi:hypothetical protein